MISTSPIRYITLERDLSGRIALHSDYRIIVRLDGPEIKGIACFTENEWALVQEILQAYPAYCPFEILIAAFGGIVTPLSIIRAREALHTAMDSTVGYDHLLKPLRNVLSRVRAKLRPLGLDITIIYQTGYMLMPNQKVEREHGNI